MTSRASADLTKIVSVAALLLALGCLGYFAIVIPADRQSFRTVFNAFHWKLPPLTEFFFSVPDVVFPAIAALIALALVVLHWYFRGNAGVALLHMFIVILCCAVLNACRELMLLQWLALMQDLAA